LLNVSSGTVCAVFLDILLQVWQHCICYSGQEWSVWSGHILGLLHH